MQYKFNNIGVDAGNISFIDMKFIKDNGGHFGDTAKSMCKLVTVPPGEYSIQYTIPDSWIGKLRGTKMINIESGNLYIGDACYAFSSSEVDHDIWIEFLNKTDYLHDMNPNGFSIDTGGDGIFGIVFNLVKYKEEK